MHSLSHVHSINLYRKKGVAIFMHIMEMLWYLWVKAQYNYAMKSHMEMDPTIVWKLQRAYKASKVQVSAHLCREYIHSGVQWQTVLIRSKGRPIATGST